jgi:hypothetical protein
MSEFQGRRTRVWQMLRRLCSDLLSLFKGSRREKVAPAVTVRDPFARFLQEFRSGSAIAEQSRKKHLSDEE